MTTCELLFAAVGAHNYVRSCNVEVTRDTVGSAAAAVTAIPGRHIFLSPVLIPDLRSLKEATAYLIANGYHRIHHGGEIVETAEFAERVASNGAYANGLDGAAAGMREGTAGGSVGGSGALMVVIDRVAVTPEGSAERVREALDKSFYLGGGRARVLKLPE